jgi:ABC-type amino acid transport substrate-binding protein
MPYKDPERKRQYQREYNRKRRGGLSKNAASRETCIKTAEDLRLLLEDVVETVRKLRDELELDAWARILLKAIDVGIKIIEVTDIEQRLTALENGRTDAMSCDA